MKNKPLLLLFFLLAGSGAMGQTMGTGPQDTASIKQPKRGDLVSFHKHYFYFTGKIWQEVEPADFHSEFVISSADTLQSNYTNANIGKWTISPTPRLDALEKQVQYLIRRTNEMQMEIDSLILERPGKVRLDTGWHLTFSIPVPTGTIGWTKWCDTCQIRYFGFYDRYHISDYPGKWSLNW
jgi:hypothetical protein